MAILRTNEHGQKHLVTSTADHDVTGLTAGDIIRVNYAATALEGFQMYLPEGLGLNYQISASVSSNNLTVALKDKDGNDPSSSSPVRIRINNTNRSCTASATQTFNAGTNYGNAGSTELATYTINWFVYAIWNTTPATDRIDIVISRYPAAKTYADLSSTATNKNWGGFSGSDTPASTDELTLIGRFDAVLSASASYNWSIPAGARVFSKPINYTDILTWNPQSVTVASMVWTISSVAYARYVFLNNRCKISVGAVGTTSGTASGEMNLTLPYNPAFAGYGGGESRDGGVYVKITCSVAPGGTIRFFKDNATSTYGLGANREGYGDVEYFI